MGVLLWGSLKEGGEGEDDEKVVCDKEDKVMMSGEGSGSGAKDTSTIRRDRDGNGWAEKARWYVE